MCPDHSLTNRKKAGISPSLSSLVRFDFNQALKHPTWDMGPKITIDGQVPHHHGNDHRRQAGDKVERAADQTYEPRRGEE